MINTPSFVQLKNMFKELPGIGEKSAQRLASELLRWEPEKADALIEAIRSARDKIRRCPQCGNYTEQIPCSICSDPERDHRLICVVAYPEDIGAIESTNVFHGLYHALGGLISPLDGVLPEHLSLEHLQKRIDENQVEELILALPSNAPGEMTMAYIVEQFGPPVTQISRLAVGLPIGLGLEYADSSTLKAAFLGRR